MIFRYSLAAVFVVIVGALIVFRDLGYLGGRTEGGPLTVGSAELGDLREPGETAGFRLPTRLDGEPVEIQYARPRLLSPGLRFRAARTVPPDDDCGVCDYPRSAPLLVGSDYDGEADVVFGLRADEPGAYYAIGFRTDYKRGSRRYRFDAQRSVCLQIGRDVPCGDAVDTGNAPLAEIGGPADYGVKVREGVAEVEPGARVDITLVNVTQRRIEVSELEDARPSAFRLRSGAGRHVRFTAAGECGARIDRLTARVEGDDVIVPLTVAVGVTDC